MLSRARERATAEKFFKNVGAPPTQPPRPPDQRAATPAPPTPPAPAPSYASPTKPTRPSRARSRLVKFGPSWRKPCGFRPKEFLARKQMARPNFSNGPLHTLIRAAPPVRPRADLAASSLRFLSHGKLGRARPRYRSHAHNFPPRPRRQCNDGSIESRERVHRLNPNPKIGPGRLIQILHERCFPRDSDGCNGQRAKLRRQLGHELERRAVHRPVPLHHFAGVGAHPAHDRGEGALGDLAGFV